MKKSNPFVTLVFAAVLIASLGLQNLQAQEGCIDPSLIDPMAFCPFIYAPVCGCNNVTYDNSCLAMVTDGVTTWTSGPCSNGDNIPPSLNVPGDLVVECGDDFEFESATASDNSGSVELIETTTSISGPCAGTVTYIRNFTATDPSGNTTTGQQQIEVVDTTPPVITIPPMDMTIGCSDPMEAEMAMFQWADGYAGAAAEDACTTVTWSNDFDAIPWITCEETVYVTVSFTASDGCGNVVNQMATLTIEPTAVEVEPCTDLAGIDFGFCDMVLGIGIINGNCSSISGCGAQVGAVNYAPAVYESMDDCMLACPIIEYGGCTYTAACNYDPNAAFEDGSCLFPPEHCPLNPETPGGGCLYSDATNFDADANWDDGTCLFGDCVDDCPEDINQDGIVTTADLLQFLSAFGQEC
jgi:hypothetical protein